MDVATVTQTIQIIIAPVVMVTACAIILGGLLSRYAAINDRLRLMSRERLDLLTIKKGGNLDEFSAERLKEIDTQNPLLLRHHELTHRAVQGVYYSIVVHIADMFIIAVEAYLKTNWLATVVLLVFLAGTGLLFWAMVLAALEIRTSHDALHYEVERVGKLE